MSILLADNFSYLGRKPLDGRILYEDLATMAGIADSTLYEGAIAYNKETNLYYSWKSDNPVDTDLGKWRELTLEGGSTRVSSYQRGESYKADSLVIYYGQIYYCPYDFTADNTELNSQASLEKDIEEGFLCQFNYMPIAPFDYTYEILNGGTGYAVNEIIGVTEPSNLSVRVTEIETTTGAILKVEGAYGDTPTGPSGSVAGINAIIHAHQNYYVGVGDTWEKMPEKKGDAFLIRDVAANVTVGGIEDGDNLPKDLAFTDFVEKLLTKKIIPAISLIASNVGVHEEGETINGTHLKLTITNLPKVTTDINQVDFLVGGTVVDTQPFVADQSVYTFGYTGPITTNTTVQVVLTYDGDKTVAKSDAIKFVYASYYGAVNTLTPGPAGITALTKTVKEGKGFTWTNAILADERFCYAYPASMGQLTSIKDANNFEYITSYTRDTVSVDGVNYLVYILTDPVTITGAKQVYA